MEREWNHIGGYNMYFLLYAKWKNGYTFIPQFIFPCAIDILLLDFIYLGRIYFGFLYICVCTSMYVREQGGEEEGAGK